MSDRLVSERLICRWCFNEVMGDDGGGWIHAHSGRRQCVPTYAEPEWEGKP